MKNKKKFVNGFSDFDQLDFYLWKKFKDIVHIDNTREYDVMIAAYVPIIQPEIKNRNT